MKLLKLKESVKPITEAPAWTATRSEEGTVTFRKSSIKDPHIIKVAEVIAQAQGKTTEEILEALSMELKRIDNMPQSPLLYGTMKQNNAEEMLFYMFCDTDVKVNGPKFNISVFYKLLARIKGEVSFMYRPISFMDRKPLLREDIKFSYLPLNFTNTNTEKVQEAKSKMPKGSIESEVDTAAVTPTGTFCYNVPFMQKLLDYAHLIDLKPEGKKYSNNGGPFPPGYAYIEFLILHEYMHFTQSDFFVDKQIKNLDHSAMNWAGDFRSNYMLIKNGYVQLPMGLFNDKMNLDRYPSLKELYEAVKKERDSLIKKQPRFKVGDKVKTPDGREGVVKSVKPDEKDDFIYDVEFGAE